MTINIQGLVLVGSYVKNKCEQLLAWTFPKGQGQQAQLPPLRLSWGALTFKDHVKLTSADIRYQRFAADGMPIRAKAGLRMYWLDPPALPTNPSSGGLPGRQSHTVVAGENLQQIATSRYGRPAAWRAIAMANGIEDPLRVHPGTVIYLPGPGELTAGSQP